MDTNSQAPRTDAVADRHPRAFYRGQAEKLIDLARSLERELAQTKDDYWAAWGLIAEYSRNLAAANDQLAAANDQAARLREALEAFVDQATKVSGFPQAYEPYVGALVLARDALVQSAS